MKRPGKSRKTSVLIVDPKWIYRNGLKHLILNRTNHQHVLEAEDIPAALKKLSNRPNIKLIVIDMSLLDTGRDPRIADILTMAGNTPVLIFSEESTRQEILDAIDGGAAGCISKSAGEEDIVRAIEVVESGAIHISKTIFDSTDQLHEKDRESLDVAVQTDAATRLTNRQREVLGELRRGLSNQNIADHLQISVNTVKIHVSSILRTLGVENRTHAALLTHSIKTDGQKAARIS